MSLELLRTLSPDENGSTGVVEPPVSVVPAVPPPATITVEGRTLTVEQAKRHMEQASEMSRLAQAGFGPVMKAMREGRITPEKAQSLIDGAGPIDPPAAPNPPAARTPDIAGIQDVVEDLVARTMTARETQRGFDQEQAIVNAALTKQGLINEKTAVPKIKALQAMVKSLLNTGLLDEQGQPIPGTAAVGEDGRPLPATAELVDKIVQYQRQQLISDGVRLKDLRLGEPPAVPPGGTGSGHSAALPTEKRSSLHLAPEEARAKNREWLAQRRPAGSTASAG